MLARKVRSYLDYFHSGNEQAEHGVFPRVLLLTTTAARQAALIEVCTRMPAEQWSLFTVTMLDRALDAMTGQIEHGIQWPGNGGER